MNTYEYILKKYNINVGHQYIVEIPNIGRDDMAKLFAELNFTKGAEIGIEGGAYSEVLCVVNPSLYLSCIDAWSVSSFEPGIEAVEYEQELYDQRYAEAVDRLAPYNCTIIRKASMEAVKDFKNNSLDFVYIDANHDFVNFINDLHYWKKKVRSGGIVSGHDYFNFPFRKFNHVKTALPAYAVCYRMLPLFIVGAAAREKGVARDHVRSWFWVKD